MPGRSLVFWFDFSSPFSHLAAQRIDAEAGARGLAVAWRPLVLGAVFQSKGYATSPNLVDPVKAAYMMRDMQRTLARSGRPFRLPAVFPVRSILSGRVALQLQDGPHVGAFSRRLFRAIFEEGRDAADPAEVAAVAREVGLDGEALVKGAESPEVKDALKAQTTAAIGDGVFGAPTFQIGRELFWGNDRLDEALDWAVNPWIAA